VTEPADDSGQGPTEAFGTVTLDVTAERWLERVGDLRSEGFDYFDWLSAYDDPPQDVAVVVRLWSLTRREGILVRTRVPRDGGVLPTLTDLWAGADWHERETFEMFGVAFAGHPNLTPLLLPDGFEGHPLRKDFVLASRVAKAWPGAKEPGESEGDRPARRRALPLGVPNPDQWGPDASAGSPPGTPTLEPAEAAE
jgi:NADH-quinone oxidoreductase subunit C